jgi:hypothetical protein
LNSHALPGATPSRWCVCQFHHSRVLFVSPVGIEPTALCLKGRCSTPELRALLPCFQRMSKIFEVIYKLLCEINLRKFLCKGKRFSGFFAERGDDEMCQRPPLDYKLRITFNMSYWSRLEYDATILYHFDVYLSGIFTRTN